MGYGLIDPKYFPAETWLWEHMTLEFEMKGNCCFFPFEQAKSFPDSFQTYSPQKFSFSFYLFHCVDGDRNYFEGEGGKREGNG